jgi:glycosyltransferase involved in cell wall biosynthesis
MRMSAKKYIVMVGPSTSSQGGIASVVMSWKNAGLFQRWPIIYLETHIEGSKLDKLLVGISALLRFLFLLASNKVVCVHLHVARRRNFWRKSAFALAAIVLRRPVLLHIHSGRFPAFFHNESNWFQKRLIRLVLGQADQLIVLSAVWHEILRPISTNRRIMVISNFVTPPARVPDDAARSKHHILFLGLLNRDKGFYDLLEAIEPLCEDFPSLMLACGGEGNQDEVVERIRQLRLENHVNLLGWISGQSKEAWLSRASFFVLPSYVEGMPMGILEAMAWGLPVISTKIGGIPDLIEHGREGLLIEPGDIVGLRDAMRQLLRNDEERGRMGLAAQSKVDREFSARAILPRVDHLYEGYCEKRIQPSDVPCLTNREG